MKTFPGVWQLACAVPAGCVTKGHLGTCTSLVPRSPPCCHLHAWPLPAATSSLRRKCENWGEAGAAAAEEQRPSMTVLSPPLLRNA